MRWAVAVAILLVAGCSQPAGPPLDDRGQIPGDIEAPPPEDYGPEVEFDPPGTPAIRGRVMSAGSPVGGARVWVEEVDIRAPENNVDDYLESRTAYLTSTDRTGAFQLRLDGALYHLTIEAAGHYMLRTEKIAPGLEGDVQEFQLVPRDAKVVAHRGASFYAPENTLSSLWKARWLGADAVEADVRMTADGHLVIFHDAWVDRTTDGEGMVRDLSLADIQQLDAGEWFAPSFRDTRVPTLAQFLAAADEARLHLVLDVKSPPDLRNATWTATLDAIAAVGAQHRTTFAVFQESGLQMCAMRQDMHCAWIRSNSTGYLDLAGAALYYGADWLMVDQSLADKGLIDRAHQLGIEVHAWTLNHPDEWRPLLALGIDGIATDRMGYLVDDLNGMPVDAP